MARGYTQSPAILVFSPKNRFQEMLRLLLFLLTRMCFEQFIFLYNMLTLGTSIGELAASPIQLTYNASGKAWVGTTTIAACDFVLPGEDITITGTTAGGIPGGAETTATVATTGSQQSTSGSQQSTSSQSTESQSTTSSQQTTSQQTTTGSEQSTTGSQQSTTDSQQLTTGSQQSTTGSQQSTTGSQSTSTSPASTTGTPTSAPGIIITIIFNSLFY